MNFILWILFGALVGWLASIVMKTDAQQGWLINIIVGVVGAFVGGLVFQMFGAQGVTGFNIYSILVATIGAIVSLAIVKAVVR